MEMKYGYPAALNLFGSHVPSMPRYFRGLILEASDRRIKT